MVWYKVLDYLKLIMLFKVLLLKKILGAGSGSRSGSGSGSGSIFF